MNEPTDLSKLARLDTESRNPASMQIDMLDAAGIVQLMSAEDAHVAKAVAAEEARIAEAIEEVAAAMRRGGRLIYIGAGTSGRLGVLDASECPPTFSTPPELVVGVIAGGATALTRAVEGAEDRPEDGAEALRKVSLTSADVVVGIATSGRTPFVLGALKEARSVGARRIGLCCTRDSEISANCEICIAPLVGPEIITGSTRLKAGTATKMVLNMLTTGAMVLLGKTFGNLMVDLNASNSKLRARSKRIVMELTGEDEAAAMQLLSATDGEVKTAIVLHHHQCDAEAARAILKRNQGRLREALADSGRP